MARFATATLVLAALLGSCKGKTLKNRQQVAAAHEMRGGNIDLGKVVITDIIDEGNGKYKMNIECPKIEKNMNKEYTIDLKSEDGKGLIAFDKATANTAGKCKAAGDLDLAKGMVDLTAEIAYTIAAELKVSSTNTFLIFVWFVFGVR